MAEKFAHIEDFIRGKPYEKHVINTFYAVENSLDETSQDEQVLASWLFQRVLEKATNSLLP